MIIPGKWVCKTSSTLRGIPGMGVGAVVKDWSVIVASPLIENTNQIMMRKTGMSHKKRIGFTEHVS
jgi:hypothetical protein